MQNQNKSSVFFTAVYVEKKPTFYTISKRANNTTSNLSG